MATNSFPVVESRASSSGVPSSLIDATGAMVDRSISSSRRVEGRLTALEDGDRPFAAVGGKDQRCPRDEGDSMSCWSGASALSTARMASIRSRSMAPCITCTFPEEPTGTYRSSTPQPSSLSGCPGRAGGQGIAADPTTKRLFVGVPRAGVVAVYHDP